MEYFLINMLPYIFIGMAVAMFTDMGIWPTLGLSVLVGIPIFILINVGLS